MPTSVSWLLCWLNLTCWGEGGQTAMSLAVNDTFELLDVFFVFKPSWLLLLKVGALKLFFT